ncbi:hypothetical protein BV898_01184 [Hypsibius exemplaris]|uniref:G-protein coupled receptors family 1 profile domain-containing protein n=1 Tax=Hypsibius exemplaris TaxID=2072580 RepID=A0A1W0XBT9_HYPEX|nr:hypothetical protein BV898_01184 [Hypsibius exemplaris]
MDLNGVPMILIFSQVAGQIFNLVIFRLWRNKEPFLTLHIALAYGNILVGAISVISPVTRWTRWTSVTETVAKVQAVLFAIGNRSTVVNTLLISIDRWLSVEFPIAYRNKVTKRKLSIAVVVGWITTIAISLPTMIVFRNKILVGCNRPSTVDYSASNPLESFLAGFQRAPIILAFLFLFQLRILMIAVETRLRLISLKNTIKAASLTTAELNVLRGQHSKLTARIIWDSLLGSMAVVMGIGLSTVPFVVLDYGGMSGRTGTTLMLNIGNNLFVVQRLYTPFVYLLFFPKFRAAAARPLIMAARWCGCTGGGGGSVGADVSSVGAGVSNKIGLMPVTYAGRRGVDSIMAADVARTL